MKLIKQTQKYVLYLLMFFVNFQELSILNLKEFSIPKLLGIIYFITILPQINSYINTKKIKQFIIPIFIFFIFLTLVNLFNINDTSSNFFDFSIFQSILLYLFLINHSRKEYMILEKGLLSLAIGTIVLSFFYKAGIGIEIINGRVHLFGDNANIIGLRMCISILIIFFIVIQNRLHLGWYRYLLLMPIPIMLNLMAETGSRVALINFVLTFLFGVLFYKTKTLWTKIVFILIGLGAFLFSWLLIMHSETLMFRLLLSYEEGDLAGRDTIWQSLIPTIQNNFFFGIGQTGYAYLFGEGSPHNVIIEVLCYTGLLGLVMYLYFLLQISLCAFNINKTKNLLLPVLLLFPIFGFILAGQILTQKLG